MADGRRRAQAIQPRHLHIHQHHVVAAVARTLHSHLAVVGHRHLGTLGAQQLQGHFLVDRVVFGQQHVQALQRQGGMGRQRCRIGQHRAGHGNALVGQRQLHPEPAALPQRAADTDAPSHQQCQPVADGQPQARAAEAPRGGRIGLLERAEQLRQLRLVDADAGVLHIEAQPARRQRAHLQLHLPTGGELHRVAQQVQQDLLQPHAVATHVLRGGGVDMQLQLHLVGGRTVGHHGHHALQAGLQGEVGRVELDLARLDLREIEDVVDHLQQMLAGIGDLAQVVQLAGTERLTPQQVRKAQHRIERRADLVAHVGQEGALGLAGGIGRRLGLGQRDLGAPALHDVPQVGAGQGQVLRSACCSGIDRAARVGRVPGGRQAHGHHRHAMALVQHRHGQHREGRVTQHHLRLHRLPAAQRLLASRLHGSQTRAVQARRWRTGAIAARPGERTQAPLGHHRRQAAHRAAHQGHQRIDAVPPQRRLVQPDGTLAQAEHGAQAQVFLGQAAVQAFQLGRALRHQLLQVLAVLRQLAVGTQAVADVDAGAHHHRAGVQVDAACHQQVRHQPAIAQAQRGLGARFLVDHHPGQRVQHRRVTVGREEVHQVAGPQRVGAVAGQLRKPAVPHQQPALRIEHEEQAGHRFHQLLAQALFLTARQLGGDGLDGVGDVAHQARVQRQLLGVEVAGAFGLQHQHAAVTSGRRDRKGRHAAAAGSRVVQHHRCVVLQGLARGPVPGQRRAVGRAGAGLDQQGVGASLGAADPGLPETAHVHRNAAHLGLQRRHVLQAHDGLVDTAEHRVGLVQPADVVGMQAALGHVLPHHRQQRPAGEIDPTQGDLHMLRAAVAPPVGVVEGQPFAGHRPAHVLAHVVGGLHGLQIDRPQPGEFIAAVAQAVAGGVVEGDEQLGLGVEQQDGVGGLAEHGVHQPRLVGQRLGTLLDQRDVAGNAQHPGRLALGVVHRRGDHLEQGAVVVRRHRQPALGGGRRAAAGHCGIVGSQRRQVVGRRRHGRQGGGRRIAAHCQPPVGRIGQQQRTLGVFQPDRVGHGLQGVGQAALAVAQALGAAVLAHGQCGQAGGEVGVDQLFVPGHAGLAAVHGKGAQRPPAGAQHRRRPAGRQAGLAGQRAEIGPARIGGDVLGHHTLATVAGGAAGPHAGPDGHAVDGLVVEVGQAGCRAMLQAGAAVVEQKHRAQAARKGRLMVQRQLAQQVGQRVAVHQAVQQTQAALVAQLRAVLAGDVGDHRHPAVHAVAHQIV